MRIYRTLLLILLLTPRAYASQSAYVTAYNDQGKMADGANTYWGALACAPSIPFGTKIEFEGLNGTFTCEDRYRAGLGFRFDIAMPGYTEEDCREITRVYNWRYA